MWKLRGDTNRTIIGTGAATTMTNDTALRAVRAVDGASSHSNHNRRAREDRGAVNLELGQPTMHQSINQSINQVGQRRFVHAQP